ncbi:MAG: protein kinase [Acidobacteriota bacterium]|nr:protein kinase [Acidobacteriota bacterium]
MTAERWQQIEQVYYTVVSSSLTRRAVILDELCSNDMEMRREVESLLDARERAGSFLSPAQLAGQFDELASESRLIGRTLGHYQILSAIGAGAMGEVYLASDTRLDRQVALKVLPAQFTRNPGRVARFRREAKAASALNHQNIMAIYDIGEIGDTWFMAAEFVQGVTLRERLAAGKMPLQETLGIAIQCALALESAHRAGIVHRDIKPENIMVRPDGLVKVVDFGLARVGAAEKAGTVDATQAGTLIGTPRYMSPEQARGEKIDGRADIFSLGAVLYEMVSGQRAFGGTTTAEVFAALLCAAPRAPSECVAGIPEDLDAIVSKALQKDLTARYRTMQEFAADLEHLKQQPEPKRVAARTPKRAAALRGGFSHARRIRRGIAIGATVLAAGLALAWYARINRPVSRPEAPGWSVAPLTSFAGYKDFASLSPNGGRIAFSWNGGQGGSGGSLMRSIYVKPIGLGDPSRLTFSGQDDVTPIWSPNNRHIAFCRQFAREPEPGQYGIYLVPASGGRERKVAEGGLGVSWSPDSQTLAIADLPTKDRGIVLVSLETGQRRRLTYPGPYFDNFPVYSRDGQWVAFIRSFGLTAREIFVIPARGGTARQLTFDRKPTYGAAWTPDGREIVFASNRGTGGESLWRVAVKGGAPRRLSPTLEGAFFPSISRQGNRLVYTQSSKDTNIYLYRGPGFGKRPAPGPFGRAEGLILSSRRDDSPSFSPDQERIAFVSKRTGNEEIWVSDRNGKSFLQLTSFKGPGTGTPRWSPDGNSIAFDSTAAGNSDIYIMGADGGARRRITAGPSGNFMPSWSPDGKWVYFKSDRSGSGQIWKVPAAGGVATQITRGGASEPFASPDGKLVYFTKGSWGAICTVPVEGGPETPVSELESFNRIFRSWGVVKQGIYFMSRQDSPDQTIRFFSFATRRVTSLVTLDKEPIWDYPDVALSPDGRRLLFACLDQEVNDLMLIENFH